MVEITVLELNLNAEDLIANAPFSSGGWGADDDDLAVAGADDGGFFAGRDDESDAEDVTADGGGPPLKPLAVGAGLLVLVLVFVAGRRLIGGEPEPLP